MSTPRLIDVHHLGRPGVIGAWIVDGVLVDPGPESSYRALVDGLAGEGPRAIALTHIHLDHAGATWRLVRRWPDVEVLVHERGAPHLVDPSKLLASAERLYGDDMDRLWGEVSPVPAANVRVLPGDGTEVAAGTLRAVATPGHASHHVSFLHEPTATAFTGDVAGVKVGDAPGFAPTPPPDIDVPAWRRSLDLIERWAPQRLAVTHFGAVDDVAAQLADVRAWLEEWPARAVELERDAFVAAFEAWLRAEAPDHDVEAARQASDPAQLWAGLRRAADKGLAGLDPAS